MSRPFKIIHNHILADLKSGMSIFEALRIYLTDEDQLMDMAFWFADNYEYTDEVTQHCIAAMILNETKSYNEYDSILALSMAAAKVSHLYTLDRQDINDIATIEEAIKIIPILCKDVKYKSCKDNTNINPEYVVPMNNVKDEVIVSLWKIEKNAITVMTDQDNFLVVFVSNHDSLKNLSETELKSCQVKEDGKGIVFPSVGITIPIFDFSDTCPF